MVYTYNKSADIDLHIDLWYKNVNVLCYCVITSKVLRSPPRHGWRLWNIYVTNDHGYVPPVVNTSRSFPHSWLITRFVTILTRQVPPVEQELFTFREHMSSPPFFSGVRVTRSLLLCVCFVDCCLSFCTFFCHCFVCSSSIYGLWLPLWYLQTLPKKMWIFLLSMMSLVEQELPTMPEFTPIFCGVRFTQPFVLCSCFVDYCLSFFLSFGHWKVCPQFSRIYYLCVIFL